MKPQFICHADFADWSPVHVFYKEKDKDKVTLPERPARLQNRHILFRKTVTLPAFVRAVVRVTADDYYHLYINGQYAGQGPAASYPHAYNHNEIDVTHLLQAGQNTFAAHTYYQGLNNRVWVSADFRECFWFELLLDGKTVLCSDDTWLCADHTGYTACGKIGYDTAFAEVYHSDAPEVGFEKADFDDSAWQPASLVKNPDYTLVKQSTAQLVWETLAPVKTETIAGGIRIDFGREAVGVISACAQGPRGAEVVLLYGEELNEDGSVRSDLRCNCHYEEKWILSGSEDVLKQYDYKAFRYAELHFGPDVTLRDVHFRVRHYPFTQQASYTRASADLQPIITLCTDTVKYGTQENYVDCPTREKGQYLGDVSVAGRAQALASGNYAMMKKAIRDFCNTTFICPGVMAVSCASLMQEIADYSLQFPAQVAWVYAQDGNLDFLRQTEPYLTGMLAYFRKYENADGLLENVSDKWNLVDWPENLRDGYVFPAGERDTGLHNVINAFWVGFLQAMDEIYGILGMPPTGLTARVQDAYVNTFYNAETGLFTDNPATDHSAVHCSVLPLLFRIGAEIPGLQDRLIDRIMQKGLTSMGVYMAYFTLAALVKHGRMDLAQQLALAPGAWNLMLSQGATTTFEAWGKEQKWNTSLFHPWATAPLIVFADDARVY